MIKIDISGIIKINGTAVDVDFNGKAEDIFGSGDPELRFAGPVGFTGSIVNCSGILKLSGRLKAGYVTRCARCLGNISGEADVTVNEDIVRKGPDTDSETYAYEGDYVDLERILRDSAFLSIPMRHVCSEACKGLCPSCGKDLNEGPCGCPEKHDSVNRIPEIR